MNGLVRHAPSILLKNIHCSIPALVHLYKTQSGSSAGGGVTHAEFPAKVESIEDGAATLQFFCDELGMGARPLEQWREKIHTAAHNRWNAKGDANSGRGGNGCAMMQPVMVTCTAPHASFPLSSVTAHTSTSTARSGRRLSFQPRQQDANFIRDAMKNLKLLLSPFVVLAPPPRVVCTSATHGTGSSGDSGDDGQRPTSYLDTSRFYATRAIPAGMFVLSLPTEAVLLAQPPPASDLVLFYFMHLEELIGQLVCAEEEGSSAPHYGYTQYLKESVVPCKNLPFLAAKDVAALVPQPESHATASFSPSPPSSSSLSALSRGGHVESTAKSEVVSPAWDLWRFFHEDMGGEPLSPYLRERLSKAEYAWWTSLVLSRREGASMMIPVVDKLNHSVSPNCYYTMSNPQSFSGLDVFDNMLAGVPLDLLYEPYVHVFTIRDVKPGEELTLCYSSAPSAMYRVGSHHPPLPLLPAGQRPMASVSSMGEVMDMLFPSSTTITSSDGGASGAEETHKDARSTHLGRQEVELPEGRARWQLQWGFVPESDAVFSESDLGEMAALVTEKRVDTRKMLFPQTSPFLSSPAAAL